jgi:hypothetical protein
MTGMDEHAHPSPSVIECAPAAAAFTLAFIAFALKKVRADL